MNNFVKKQQNLNIFVKKIVVKNHNGRLLEFLKKFHFSDFGERSGQLRIRHLVVALTNHPGWCWYIYSTFALAMTQRKLTSQRFRSALIEFLVELAGLILGLASAEAEMDSLGWRLTISGVWVFTGSLMGSATGLDGAEPKID